MTYSVLVTFGTATEHATTATTCDSLQSAMVCASSALAAEHNTSLLFEVAIRPGDHAPRLVNGAWAWPPQDGWTVSA